jgi:GNAT superfamily N-acetyltransferase
MISFLMTMMMKIERISSIETRALRHEVLWPHRESIDACFIDIDDREDAIHLGAYHQHQLVGVCSLFQMDTLKLIDKKQYRLRAMATHPSVRGLGAGRQLVEHALDIVEALDFDVLWCDAREVALGFYEKLGFERIDEWYDIPNIGPHQFMYFRFKR